MDGVGESMKEAGISASKHFTLKQTSPSIYKNLNEIQTLTRVGSNPTSRVACKLIINEEGEIKMNIEVSRYNSIKLLRRLKRYVGV